MSRQHWAIVREPRMRRKRWSIMRTPAWTLHDSLVIFTSTECITITSFVAELLQYSIICAQVRVHSRLSISWQDGGDIVTLWIGSHDCVCSIRTAAKMVKEKRAMIALLFASNVTIYLASRRRSINEAIVTLQFWDCVGLCTKSPCLYG